VSKVSPYRLLGVDRGADLDSIRAAFRRAALRYHPDTFDGPPEEASRLFREVVEAYEAIVEELAEGGTSPPGSPGDAHPDVRRVSPGEIATDWNYWRPAGRTRRKRFTSPPWDKGIPTSVLALGLFLCLAFILVAILPMLFVLDKAERSKRTSSEGEDEEFLPCACCCLLTAIGIAAIVLALRLYDRSR